MSLQDVIMLFIGTGGMGVLVSAWLTRKSSREENEVNLLDRAYQVIDRLDAKILVLETKLEAEKDGNKELEEIIRGLKEDLSDLKLNLKSYEDIK